MKLLFLLSELMHGITGKIAEPELFGFLNVFLLAFLVCRCHC